MNRINLLFGLLLIILFSSCGNDSIRNYAETPEEMLKNYLKRDNFVSPDEMLKIAASSDDSYRLIDIRTPEKFINGHVGNAVNIPLHDALNPEYSDIFKTKKVTNVIYGEGHEDVVDIYLMFNELGITGNKFFKGGYVFIESNGKVKTGIDDEKPAFDFAKKLKELAGKSGSDQPQINNKPKKKPIIRRKKREVEGGCS